MGYIGPIIVILLFIVIVDTWINSRVIRKELEVIKEHTGIKDENMKLTDKI